MTKALFVNQLTKIYKNDVTALAGIDLEVAQGDFFALLGKNGAGKSTTIGILCSLVNKTSGKVLIFGYDIDTDLENAKACIGIVPQEMNFNPFEKVMQIALNQAGYYGVPRKVAEQRAELYLKKMGLWGKRDQIALRLSGGMKRRLMIVRALMNEPKLLILDEPTAGVDIELRHQLWHFLTELNQQGTTIILTTHYLEEAEHLCKNVAIIDHGKIIVNAEMKSLINRVPMQTIILDLKKTMTEPLTLDYPHHFLDELTIEVEVQKDLSLNHLFDQLSKQHITITGIRNKTNRLEELFVRLVHKSS